MFWGKARVWVVMVLLSAAMLLVPLHAVATDATATTSLPADLIITELKVNNDKAGYNEFLELYNNSANSLNLANYNVMYFNATDPAVGNSFTLTPVVNDGPSWLPAHEYYTLASSGSALPIGADAALSFALSDSGGQLMVVNSANKLTDKIIWTSTKANSSATILYVSSATATQSWQRSFDATGSPLATEVQAVPSPQSTQLLCDQEGTPPTANASGVQQCVMQPTTTSSGGTTTGADSSSSAGDDNSPAVDASTLPDQSQLLPPQITELLPNPVSPQTDDQDEFIELYNPNGQAFDLKGYVLETGTTTLHDFTFTDDQTIAPNAYEAFYSKDTNLSLSNTSGQARLLDPNQQMVSQTDAYGAAKDGYAWAYISNSWQWTTTPTPGDANDLTAPAATTAAAKTTATTKKAAAKVKGATTTKTKKAAKSSTAKATGSDTATNASATLPTSSIHPWILAGIGGLALLYAAYEYREDMANKLQQFRANRSARRAGR